VYFLQFGKTQLLPLENAAVLQIAHLRSEHLGFVACRCPHCWVPQFDLLRLEFPVPLSVHIPPQSSDQQQQQHMIVHGFPLDGPIRMEITKIDDAENRTEIHEFQGNGNDDRNLIGSVEHKDIYQKTDTDLNLIMIHKICFLYLLEYATQLKFLPITNEQIYKKKGKIDVNGRQYTQDYSCQKNGLILPPIS
jgi:hypothetical protein